MNDKTVINTISTIYFVIVSFLSFIFLTLTTVFIVLQNGLYIDNISIPNVKIKQLYIKWNEKIDISVKEIYVNNSQSNNQTKIDYKEIDQYLKSLSLASNWFESIVFEKITFNDIHGSYKHKDRGRGFIIVSSPDFYMNSSIYFEDDFLNMQIKELKDFKRKININGSLFFNASKLELSSVLNLNVNNDLDATVFIDTDINKLSYKLKANKDVKSIEHLINIANLPKEVRYWAFEAIDMSSLTINSASGFIEFDKLDMALKNILIHATVNNLNYTYNPKLDSIHTSTTKLEFSDGVLFIRPQNSFSYGMPLEKSWLKIDFTTKEELLTLHLLFDGIVNKDMLHILNTYKIKLPFLQKTGKVATNLIITVNLRTIAIDARGDFFTKKANFDYIGLNIDIFDAYIKLDNYDVTIDNMKATYEDMAKAEVDLVYSAKTSTGTVLFKTEYIGFNKGAIVLNNNPINIAYNISPNNDTIDIEKSQWKVNDFIFSLNKTTLAFDLNTLQILIPPTLLKINDFASGFIAGSVDLSTMQANLGADVLKLNYMGIELSRSNTPLNIFYDKELHISSVSNILFNMDGSEFDVSNAAIDIGSHSINLKHANLLSLDGLFGVEVDAFYNTKNGSGIVGFQNLNIEDKNNKNLFYSKDKILFSFETLKDDGVKAYSKDLDASFILKDKGWSAQLNSLSKISNDSELLKKFKLTKGKINFHKNDDENSIRFNADIAYPYKLLVSKNRPIEKYKIKGKLSSKKSSLSINNRVNVKISDNIKINIKNSGINIPELLDFLSDLNTSSEDKKSKSIILDATDSYLYVGNDRRIISDKMELQYHNGITTAQLEHKEGHAGFKLDDNKIHLYGENFNDEFMKNLFSLADFKGGTLDFSMHGTVDNYDGLFYISETTMLDYKMLNNILAFVNTVPSLATFSLPGYSKSGLKVESAYLNFNSKKSVFTVSDFFLDSKEIDILGSGTADLNKDKIDAVLNLKTDLGSNIAKIPIVGYIILGKDTISTTMSITGKLTDPKVKSLIAKDIVVAPVNIVKRTLLLPYNLIKSIKDINTSK